MNSNTLDIFKSEKRFLGERIAKRPVRVKVKMLNGQELVGNLHIKEKYRVIDDLNYQSRDEEFLAMTDVCDGKNRFPFLMIHRPNISWIAPLEE